MYIYTYCDVSLTSPHVPVYPIFSIYNIYNIHGIFLYRFGDLIFL